MKGDDKASKQIVSDTVESCSRQLKIWGRICDVIAGNQFDHLLTTISQVPIRRSRSTTTLGCYVSRHGAPHCIRLQFDQEDDLLADTLLHEVAHLLDHLVSFSGSAYRGAHRKGWQHWALALGISTSRTGKSERLAENYQQRSKLVAVCTGCGEKFYRIRRLNRNRVYVHKQCGSQLKSM